jgi:hypothetical protein
MSCTAAQAYEISPDELRNISVDMSGLLDEGELLTGTPEVQASEFLTIVDAQINSVAVTINGTSVAAGLAVQFRVSSLVEDDYFIEVLCDTDGGQIVEGTLHLTVRESHH